MIMMAVTLRLCDSESDNRQRDSPTKLSRFKLDRDFGNLLVLVDSEGHWQSLR